MYKSSFKACLLVLVLMSPWTGFAAGLGKLKINSALGQPLQAEIDLVAVKNEEISSLAAQLGSHEAFRQAGIDYKSFFSAFKITIEPRSNGDPFIKITSPNAINEPFLNMLVELSWASGRLMREYTVLLDPVESVIPEPVAPITNNDSVAINTQSKKIAASVSPVEQATDPEVPKSASVSDTHGGTTYGPVIQGDTLSGIAGQISPQGVSLNQVLIAMFRANRDAFIEDNINLLKVGVVLRIPDRSEIVAISESEANKEVKVQVADWRSYRNRLVTAMTESPADEVLKQSDEGQITTTSADDAIAINEAPTEVLRLSSGAQLEELSSDGGNENVMPQDRLQMMEEDAIARNFALNEANERIAMLEKNIQDLQHLLELKDPALAEAQMQAESLLSSESTVSELDFAQETELVHETDSELESDSIAVLPDSSELLSDMEMEATISQDTIEQSDVSESVVVSDELIPNKEVSLIDQLMKNIEYVGGAVTFLLLGTLAVVRMRRKKSDDDLETDDMEFDASAALRERMASVKAVDSLASNETDAAHIDPDSAATDDALVGEQNEEDMYQAERDTSVDENIDEVAANNKMAPEDDLLDEPEVLSGKSVEPDNEIEIDLGDTVDNYQQVEHSEHSDDVEFNLDLDQPASAADIATQDQDLHEPSSATDLAIPDQEKSELDLSIDDEPLLEEPAVFESATNDPDDMLNRDISEPTDSKGFDETLVQAEVETVPFETENDITFDLDASADEMSKAPVSADESAVNDRSEALDLAIDFPSDAESTVQDEAGKTEEAAPDTERTTNQDEKLDLDLDRQSDTNTPMFDSNLLSSDSSLSDLKSEMNITTPESEETVAPVDKSVSSEKDERWHEVETKIDLARAYLDMEDKEGAREILEEIINEGDAQQKENAETLLAEL